MAQVNQSSAPLVSLGGTPGYSYQIITDSDTTIPASIDSNNNLIVDATGSGVGYYQVKIRATDSLGINGVQIVPIIVVDNSGFLILNSSSNFVSDTFPFNSSIKLVSFGGSGSTTWSLLPGSIPGATISSSGVASFQFYQSGTSNLIVQAKDSSGKTASKSITLSVSPSKSYAIKDGEIEVELKDIQTAGPSSFDAVVQDSQGNILSRTFNFDIGSPLSDIRIRPYTFDRYLSNKDSGPFSLPIDGNLSDNGVIDIHSKPTVNVLGMSLDIDDSTNQVVLSGPPTSFGNADVLVSADLKQNSAVIGSVNRILSLQTFNGPDPSSLGTNTISAYPMTVGSSIGFNLQKVGFNTFKSSRDSGWMVQMAPDSILPPGLSLDQETGIIYGPLLDTFDSISTVQFVDGSGSIKGTFNINWDILEQDFSVHESLPAGIMGRSYTGNITTGSTSDLVSVQVYKGFLPSGLSLSISSTDPSKAVLSGTLTSCGYFDFWLVLTNEDGKQGYLYKRLGCKFGLPVKIATTMIPDEITGEGFSYQLTSTGGITPHVWSLDSTSPALPNGITLTSDGLLNGTPTDTSYDQNVVFKVTDFSGTSVTKPLEMVVSNQIKIKDIVLPIIQTGKSYEVILQASGGSGPGTYTWSLAPGSPTLPTGITLSTIASTDGHLMGTTSLLSYDQTIIVRVLDTGGNSATKSLRLHINNSGVQALSIDVSGVGAIKRGCAYQGVLKASGGTLPYKWSKDPSSVDQLYTGLALSSDGNITGSTVTLPPTPTSGNLLGGINVTFRVVDAVGAYGVRTINLQTIPSVSASVDQPILYGRIGQVMDVTLGSASGCKSPFTWSALGGSYVLPAGLSITGAGHLTGTPVQNGLDQAHGGIVLGASTQQGCLVRDAINDSVQVLYSLIINASTLAITTTSLPDGVVGNSYSATLAASGGTAPYKWSLSPQNSTPLPTGISFTSAGVLSGTVSTVTTGSILFRVTDASGTPFDKSLSLTTKSLVSFISGPDYIHKTTDGIIGQIEQDSANAYGMSLSGTNDEWLHRYSNAFLVGVIGLPINAQTGYQIQNYTVTSDHGATWIYTSSETVSGIGTIFWYSMSISNTATLAANSIVTLAMKVSGPGLGTPATQQLKLATKIRKSLTLLDGNGKVISNLGSFYS